MNPRVSKFKDYVNHKFGNNGKRGLAPFCRCSNRNLEETVQFLKQCNENLLPQRIAKLSSMEIEARTLTKSDDPTFISDELRQAIREALNKRGGVYKFCNANKLHSPVSIFQIMQGKRTHITKKVKSLLIDLDLKKFADKV